MTFQTCSCIPGQDYKAKIQEESSYDFQQTSFHPHLDNSFLYTLTEEFWPHWCPHSKKAKGNNSPQKRAELGKHVNTAIYKDTSRRPKASPTKSSAKNPELPEPAIPTQEGCSRSQTHELGTTNFPTSSLAEDFPLPGIKLALGFYTSTSHKCG